MRVLYASFDEVPALKGASTHILAICRRARIHHDVHLVSLGQVQLPPEVGFHHHPLPIVESNYLRRGLAFRSRCARLIEALAPDLIHVRTPWEGIAAVASGRPLLYEVNGLPSLELPRLYPGAPLETLTTLRGWEDDCLRFARAVMCPSTVTRDLLVARGVRRERAVVLPNGYERRPLGLRDEERTPSPPLRLVYLGGLQPWQGVSWALGAFPSLRGTATLDIIGPPHRTWTPLLQRRLRRHGLGDVVALRNPLHRGRLGELAAYHVGIAPLLPDTRNRVQGCFPVKLAEYLSNAVPVIAADLPVTCQLIRHEDNGLLFPAGDRAGFADAVRRLALDHTLRERLARQSQVSLAGLPTWDQHGDAVAALYGQIMKASAVVWPDRSDTLPARARS